MIVSEIMTKHPLTVTPDTPIKIAAKLMRKYKIASLPVLDQGKVAGIITGSDLFDAFIKIMGGKHSRFEAHADPGGQTWRPCKRHLHHLQARLKYLEYRHGSACNKRKGYAGAREMSDFLENMWGWQVRIPESVGPTKWRQAYEVYVKDKYGPRIKAFMEKAGCGFHLRHGSK